MKFLSHLVPREGAGSALEDRLFAFVKQLRSRTDRSEIEIELLFRLSDDIFGKTTPFYATLDIHGDAATPKRLAQLLEEFGEQIDDVAHADLSTALAGVDVPFIEPDLTTAVRYQYLMRRRVGFSHEAYLARYRDVHSEFGRKTPGILGYVQFHVDPAASQQVARAAGLGSWRIDSVSQLSLESQETFVAAVSKSTIGPEAIADEELFVDRPRSFHFCSRRTNV